MELSVKITPRVAAPVARRLRLAASMRSLPMSRLVNDALDQALPSLEEIGIQLAPPRKGKSGTLAEIAERYPGPVVVATTRGPAVPETQALEGGAGDGSGC